MIRIRDVHKRFGKTVALDGIELEVSAGERVGFLGRNGAGKSTLLRIIAGFISPDTGQCSVNGVDVVREPMRAQRSLGFLPEGAPAYREMRAGDYLRMRARLKGMRRGAARKAAEEGLKSVGLGDRGRSRVEDLSRGMRQRLGLANALLGEPRLLILDEPTSGLDPAQLRALTASVRALAGDRALILASHRLDAVRSLCTRVIVVASGKVVFDGPTDELAERGSGDLEAAFLSLTEGGAG